MGALLRGNDADVEPIGVGRSRVRVGSGSNEWLLSIVAMLAGSFRVVVREPADLVARVERA